MANAKSSFFGRIKKSRFTKNNKLAIFLVILAAIIVVGVIGFWGYAVMNNPQTKLVNAFQKLSNKDTVAADFNVKSDDPYTGEFTFQRDSDSESNYQFRGQLEQNGAQINANLRSVNDAFYLRFSSLENLDSFTADSGSGEQPESRVLLRFLQDLNDTWIEVTKEDAARFFGQSSVFNFGGSEQDNQKIFDAYESHPFFNIKADGSDEIQGVDTSHMVLRFNKDEYVAFLEDIRSKNLETIEITDAQIQSARENEQAENAEIETWIAKGNGEFKRVKLYEKNSQSEFVQITFKPSDSEDVNVTAPENSRNLQQIFQEFLSEAQQNNSVRSGATQAR